MEFIKKNRFIFMTIVIIGFAIADLYSLFSMYLRYDDIIQTNVQSVSYIKDIHLYMNDIDNNILYSINELNREKNQNVDVDISEYTNKISNYMTKCTSTMDSYSKLNKNKAEDNRYTLFTYYFESYAEYVNNVLGYLNSKDVSNAESTYNLKLVPVENCTSEILSALEDLSNATKNYRIKATGKYGEAIGVVTLIVTLAIVVVINVMSAVQKRANAQLEKNKKTIEKQQSTVNTAVFNDILTDCNNRMSFVNTYSKGKSKIGENQAYYFIMFNIDNFNAVNINYGSNSGDMILSSTSDRLKKCFTDADIYRTGSDEFVVVMKEIAGNEGYNKVINFINNARMTLAQPHGINNGSLSVMYSVSLVKKTGPSDIDLSVLESLKDAMNRGRMSQTNTVSFIDLDFITNTKA